MHNRLLLQKHHGTLTCVHADEMESFEHTKCKPLSIPLAVSDESQFILALDVVEMPAKGPLAEISRRKYGPRQDFRKAAFEKVITEVKPFYLKTPGNLTIRSDQKTMYRPTLKRLLPEVTHQAFKGRRAVVVGQGELKEGGYDPLFYLNHAAAMIRSNVNRLARRTWATTKKRERLYDHLCIYAYYHNSILLPLRRREKICSKV